AEQRVMREAAEISVSADIRALRACRPGVMGGQREADILHGFDRNGARGPVYLTMVCGRKYGSILQYIDNDAALRDGELVLIDAGCELEGYAADITRTFPVNGRFSAEQRALYDIVLAAQGAAIATLVPGAHWNEPHEASVRTITQGLLQLGLLEGELEQLIIDEAYRPFYMRRIGHWLGMDVHDVGDYKVGGEWRVLEPGMVMTVEPGIYVAPDNLNVAKKWRGIGIRIEDDVLIIKSGCDVLTQALPKTAEAIEALMAEHD